MSFLRKTIFATIGLAVSLSQKLINIVEKAFDKDVLDKKAEQIGQNTTKFVEQKITKIINEMEQISKELKKNPKILQLQKRMEELQKQMVSLLNER